MAGASITNVKAVMSTSGDWSIDEEGKLVVKEVQAEKLCLGSTCISEPELRNLFNMQISPSPSPPPLLNDENEGIKESP